MYNLGSRSFHGTYGKYREFEISGQTSKTIDEKLLMSMDLVITLCGNAEVACPGTPPGIKRLHWPINDPVWTMGSGEKIMKEFRRERDKIRKRIVQLMVEKKDTPFYFSSFCVML